MASTGPASPRSYGGGQGRYPGRWCAATPACGRHRPRGDRQDRGAPIGSRILVDPFGVEHGGVGDDLVEERGLRRAIDAGQPGVGRRGGQRANRRPNGR